VADSALRIYDPAECSDDGKPLDWDRCRNCGGEGRKGLWRAGSIVRVEDGVASATCAVCGGHGSLKAAALAHCMERQV
jgi:hypothetical protein